MSIERKEEHRVAYTDRLSYLYSTIEYNTMASSVFDASLIQDNATGWGPTGDDSVITTAPFMPFDKGSRLIGRIAEFGADKRYGRQQYNRGTTRGRLLLKLNAARWFSGISGPRAPRPRSTVRGTTSGNSVG